MKEKIKYAKYIYIYKIDFRISNSKGTENNTRIISTPVSLCNFHFKKPKCKLYQS